MGPPILLLTCVDAQQWNCCGARIINNCNGFVAHAQFEELGLWRSVPAVRPDHDYLQEAKVTGNKGNPAATAAAAMKRYTAAKTPSGKAKAAKAVQRNINRLRDATEQSNA